MLKVSYSTFFVGVIFLICGFYIRALPITLVFIILAFCLFGVGLFTGINSWMKNKNSSLVIVQAIPIVFNFMCFSVMIIMLIVILSALFGI